MKTRNLKRSGLIVLGCFLVIGSLGYRFFSNSTVAVLAPTVSRPLMSEVGITKAIKDKATDLNYSDIRALVREAVSSVGGLKGVVKEGDNVVIKPNLVGITDLSPEAHLLSKEMNGVTTDWRVTKAVVELVRELDKSGNLYIMEGSVGHTKDFMKYYNYTPENIPGVTEFIAIEEDSGAWQDFNSKGLVAVSLPKGLIHNKYYLNKKYQQADVLISIPVLKNHFNAAVSGAIKNCSIGATPANIYGSTEGSQWRSDTMVPHDDPSGSLHKWIHDYYMCKPINFVVMDGLQGIQNGPTPNTFYVLSQMNMRTIITGRDPIAVDTIEALAMCWDPESVKYLKFLDADKAGNLDVGKIKVIGKQVDEIRKDFQGVLPPAGGIKITDEIAPTLTIKSCTFKGGKLNLALLTGADIKKIEVYIDNKIISTISSNFNNISISPGKLNKLDHNLKLWAFDRFLNRTEKILTFKNEIDSN